MRTIRKQIVVGMTVLGLGLGLGAQAHAYPQGGEPGRHAAHMKERLEKRAADMRAKLNLTPQQQPAWEAYVARMMPGERTARPSREEMAKLTAPERMEKMHQMMKQGEQKMAERVAATREFYAVLTPEQRKIFDENFHFKRGHGKRGMMQG